MAIIRSAQPLEVVRTRVILEGSIPEIMLAGRAPGR